MKAPTFFLFWGLISMPVIAQIPPTPGLFQESMLHGKEFLLNQRDVRKGVFPQDYELGPLQGWNIPNKEEEEGFNTMQLFLSGLLTKDPMASFIAETWKSLLVANITEAFEKGLYPKSFRLGKLQWENPSTLYAPFSIRGTVGVARGLLYVEKISNTWKISDLQVNWDDLNVETAPRKEQFIVGGYSFQRSF